ncbi:MAG: adenosine deaminase [Candidatus Berkelbacteria bacterium Gr01-1014_85]|uniref:Adenosine deaminase n=1 Tax=Candidatus Berkelbacteria bacterium Gr01-1014_85 TaxID=2017150 RepID=A0A554JBB5_9BACT|nr:MAG: adenosine deaminase [Candidatus Berkelbacteria bacterium Gr01-1014_85]
MTTNDEQYIRLALSAAKQCLEAGEYPVSAILVIDDELIEIVSNQNISRSTWGSHAESLVLQRHSSLIREKTQRLSLEKEAQGKIELYTTLEPCLMCLGTAVLHKVKRIIYSCPDPRGGVALIKPEELTKFYQERWPEIQGNIFWEDSYHLITTYLANQKEDFWPAILDSFEKMYSDLKKWPPRVGWPSGSI